MISAVLSLALFVTQPSFSEFSDSCITNSKGNSVCIGNTVQMHFRKSKRKVIPVRAKVEGVYLPDRVAVVYVDGGGWPYRFVSKLESLGAEVDCYESICSKDKKKVLFKSGSHSYRSGAAIQTFDSGYVVVGWSDGGGFYWEDLFQYSDLLIQP